MTLTRIKNLCDATVELYSIFICKFYRKFSEHASVFVKGEVNRVGSQKTGVGSQKFEDRRLHSEAAGTRIKVLLLDFQKAIAKRFKFSLPKQVQEVQNIRSSKYIEQE